jgi:HAD superfamily hydrolase (TIGR01459 family)
MTAPQLISGLSAIADRYDLILSDVWGVIHNGLESFPAATGALTHFGQERGPVILISNAARPSHDVVSQLDQLQVPRAAWKAFVSSGDATRILLAEHAPGPAWAIGTERHASLYAGLPLTFADPQDAAFISCAGPYDDEVDAPGDYRARFEAAVARGLPMICANPDLVVQRGTRLLYCAGALAQLYAELGGQVFMSGKPHAPIYELCLLEGQALLGRPIDRRRVLCIGDGLPTDIKGANAQGLDVLFVASGIHGAETIGSDGLDLAAVARLLDQAGASATYAMADLTW